MALPYFYVPDVTPATIVLDEDTSKHITQVLRMKQQEPLLLTDGKGTKATAIIVDDNRKRCTVNITKRQMEHKKEPHIAIAISLIKNASRFEWFLEKATEIGVNEIIPLLCSRTEKEKFRHDRMQTILISAMLQSQQCWLPHLHMPAHFMQVIMEAGFQKKFIAHCLPQSKTALTTATKGLEKDVIILIGPEGDFTSQEIEGALSKGFVPVTLGNTRLRTETAGMVAAALLRNIE